MWDVDHTGGFDGGGQLNEAAVTRTTCTLLLVPRSQECDIGSDEWVYTFQVAAANSCSISRRCVTNR